MNEVLSLILGGGRGTRLFPLTMLRSKPAVPLAGKYRLIDIPISNCLNSGCSRIYVLTQFLSVSLHRHIANTYKFDAFGHSFVEILAAQQTNEASDWGQGRGSGAADGTCRGELTSAAWASTPSSARRFSISSATTLRLAISAKKSSRGASARIASRPSSSTVTGRTWARAKSTARRTWP